MLLYGDFKLYAAVGKTNLKLVMDYKIKDSLEELK